ncbi:MAG TPA: hypothetical protein VK249_15260, partial [Anaerolineales bacterium]|nr:hypothetical protein [Anaerolineales bacterium]
MRKWLVFALLFGSMIFPSTAGAQGGIKLDAMKVELWSEYDQPSMLVINQFVVSQDTALPVTVTLRFPKDGNLVAVAEQNSSGLFDKDFKGPVAQGNWQTITINVDSYQPHRMEYYQPLIRDGNKRQFKYQWFGDYYVKEFTVAILVPADSTELITSPVLQSTATAENGSALSGIVTKSELKMGNSFQFDLAYQRTSDTLTNPTDQVQPSEPVGADTPGRVSIANLPWIIGGFGLALIIIALFSYWRSTQSGEAKPQRAPEWR